MKYIMLLLILIASAVGAEKPNFLLIFTDDQTYQAIGYNYPLIKTPHLDSLAKTGLIFDHAYVASPICAASRASLFTGLFPQQHGVIALNKKGFKQFTAGGKRSKETLASQLSAAGYRTAMYGKSHLGNPQKFGFMEGEDCQDVEAFIGSHRFLEDHAERSQPFFLCLTPHKPHLPLKPDQKWLNLYDTEAIALAKNYREKPTVSSINNQGTSRKTLYRDSAYTNNYKKLSAGPPRNEANIKEFSKAYYATISQLDDEVGSLIEKLKRLNLFDNTLIIFLSDNGYFLGNHGLGNKITMHEESVRVPMFMHWKKKNERWNGVRTKALTSSLDIYPTIAKLAGLETLAHLQGKSLVPVMNKPNTRVREYVFSECVGVGGEAGEGHRMARSEGWKYVLTARDEEFLFDESKDPFELNNLAHSPEQQNILRTMRITLTEWMRSNNDREHPQVENK